MCSCCQTTDSGVPAIVGGRDFTVTGMTCQSCASKVSTVVGAVPGVDAVSVNVAAERITVTGVASEQTIAAAVTAAGYHFTGPAA